MKMWLVCVILATQPLRFQRHVLYIMARYTYIYILPLINLSTIYTILHMHRSVNPSPQPVSSQSHSVLALPIDELLVSLLSFVERISMPATSVEGLVTDPIPSR